MSQISNDPNPKISKGLTQLETRKAKKIANTLFELIIKRQEMQAEETKLKADLKELLKPAYFILNEKATTPDQVNHTFDLHNLQINFVDQYFLKDDLALKNLEEVLGTKHPLLQYLTETVKVNVDVSKLNAEDANELAKDITTAAMEYGIKPGVSRTPEVLPGFHSARHIYLSADDNLELDKTLPVQMQTSVI